MAAYSQAVEIFPFFVEALDNRGFTRMEMGDYRAAIGDFELAIEAQRNIPPQEHDPTSLFSLGECHHRLGELEKARGIFKQFLERWPNNPTIRAYLPLHPELGVGLPSKKPWWKFW